MRQEDSFPIATCSDDGAEVVPAAAVAATSPGSHGSPDPRAPAGGAEPVLSACERERCALTAQPGGFLVGAGMDSRMSAGEDELRLLIENASDVLAVTDGAGVVRYISPAIERVLGIEAAHVVGHSIFDFAHPADVAAAVRAFERAARSERPDPRVVCRCRHRDGSFRTLEAIGKGVRDGSGAAFVVVNARDITERQQVEARLAAQLATASTLAASAMLSEAAPRVLLSLVTQLGWDLAAIWLVEPEQPALRCTELAHAEGADYAAFEALCRSALVPRGDSLLGAVWASGAPRCLRDVRQGTLALQVPGALEAGLRSVCAVPVTIDGEVVGVLAIMGREVRRADEELVRVLATIGSQIGQFIKRQRAEERLVRTTAELEALFRSLPDLCFRLDAAGRIIDYNAARLSDLYAPPSAFLGKVPAEVLPPSVASAVDDARARAHTIGSVVTVEYCLPIAGEERHYEARLAPFLGGQTVVLIRDVTSRRRAEEALRQREERSRESQKMEAIGRLAGGIAHDFNNLLMAILGYGDLLLRRLGPDHALGREVGEIKKAGERAASLTRQLLAFSRKQVLQAKVLDLNAIVVDMQAMLRRLIGEDIDLKAVTAGALGAIKADRGQLEQVLLNLAVNARDAMPRGGRLVIETSNVTVRRTEPPLDLGIPAGSYVLLEVSDTGSGMDAETQSHVFEPFFTTKDRGKGTGLGLATVYGIVKQSGGYIAVDSEVGRGTRFRIYLPRVPRIDESMDAPAAPSFAPPASGSETVLVVEDDEAVAALIAEVLDRCGYRTLSARSGDAALATLTGSGVHLDLLLTDLVLPGMSGHELAARASASLPSLRVLYMSGYSDEAVGDGNPLDPDTEFLQKPFTPEMLARRVREVLDGPGPVQASEQAPSG